MSTRQEIQFNEINQLVGDIKNGTSNAVNLLDIPKEVKEEYHEITKRLHNAVAHCGTDSSMVRVNEIAAELERFAPKLVPIKRSFISKLFKRKL